MTRKRFIKLLMAEGYSRNSANNIAGDVLKDGRSYAEAYDQITRLLPLMQAMAAPIADAVKKMTEAIGRVTRAVAEAVSAAAEAFSAAMSQT